MKTLLVPVAMHDALPSVFETTRLAASRFGSLIEGVSLRPALAEYVPVDMVGGMTWLRDEEADIAEAEEAGSRFVAAMDAAGIPRHPRDGQCNPAKVMEAGRATGGARTCRPATPSSANMPACSRPPWSGGRGPATTPRA